MGLSSLRYHKKIIDTHFEQCLCNQGIEDTNHLFLCPFFATRRATLAINVIVILQKYYLTLLETNYACIYIGITLNFTAIEKSSC